MKIALAHKMLNLRGGTEKDFYRTAEGLRDLGHEIHLFCSEFHVSPPEGVHVHEIPSWPLGRTARFLSFAFRAPKVISAYSADVVVSFGRMVSQDVLRSGGGTHRLFLKKMAQGEGGLRRLWHRVSLYHRCVLAVERVQYRSSGYQKILAVSREVKREIVTAYGVPEEKIAVIYNGVDLVRFHPRQRNTGRARIRSECGIPLEASVVLFVGNGFQRKGLDRLLKVWGSDRLRGIYLLVVGEDARDYLYRSWAERQARDKIVFAGRQDRIEDYYSAADVFALPAFQEAFGNVVLEALASGLPVLTSRTVGACELLEGELRGGILADADDPEEIATKVLGLVDRAGWGARSEHARSVAEKYSWTKHFKEFENHLLEVAATNQRGVPF